MMYPQVTEKALLIPRLTDMRDGRWRPELSLPTTGEADIVLLEPMADADAAWERARDVIELVPGDWTDNGRWYVCP
jgi:hypothetical protein